MTDLPKKGELVTAHWSGGRYAFGLEFRRTEMLWDG